MPLRPVAAFSVSIQPVKSGRQILRQMLGRRRQQLGLGHHGRQWPAADLPPLAGVLEPGEVAADRGPELGVDPAQAELAQARRRVREGQVVQTAAEKRGRSSTTSLGAALPKSASAKPATSSSMPCAGSAAWAVPSAASVATIAKGSMPCSRRLRRLKAPRRLENCRPAASAISGRWAKARRRGIQRSQDRELERGVADVVLAADDVGDAQLGIVHGGREQVGGAAVLALDDGIAQRAPGRSCGDP